MRGIQGFTLIEVLIALVILAISLTAVTYGISRNAQNSTYIDQKMAAHWVAMNIISGEEVKAEVPNSTIPGESDGSTIMLNHTWYWTASTQAIGTGSGYRMTVTVSATQNGPSIEHLDTFLYHPLAM
ncbi:MAG: type II secretion system minor pseudopilin GspI [Gammaproteobacteria bacterium]|nr:type II secretion system minor pseudopilin GspI [Gammaproteobacteria bacterium]